LKEGNNGALWTTTAYKNYKTPAIHFCLIQCTKFLKKRYIFYIFNDNLKKKNINTNQEEQLSARCFLLHRPQLTQINLMVGQCENMRGQKCQRGDQTPSSTPCAHVLISCTSDDNMKPDRSRAVQWRIQDSFNGGVLKLKRLMVSKRLCLPPYNINKYHVFI
jgi:hypothetical protein